MISTLLCLALMSQDVKYANPKLDLEFTHPSTWKVSEEKNASKFIIPIDAQQATLEIFDVDYRADSETWMNVEKTMAEQLKKTLQRQWQEEVLGVPLLLTLTNSIEADVPVSTLSGLLYSATPRKLRFRLIAPSTAYEAAEKAWRDVLLSLRTTSGKLPTGETPDRNPEIIPLVKPPTTFRPSPKKDPPKERRKGEVALSVPYDGKTLILRVPNGWSVSRGDDGVIAIKNPLVTGVVTISVLAAENVQAPGRILMRESAKSLALYTKVDKRTEKGPIDSAAGSRMAWIRREGTGKNGMLFTLDAIGITGDYFWLFTYRSEDKLAQAKEQALLSEFLNVTCVELAP